MLCHDDDDDENFTTDRFGNKQWSDAEGLPHRVGHPAIISADGTLRYYTHGVRDNPNGPAVIYTNGNLEYWVQGKCELIRNTKSFQKNDEQAAQNSCFRNQLVSHSSMADIIKARLERNPFPGPLAADDRSKETTTTTTTPKSHFNPGVNFLHDGTEVWVDDDGEYHRDGDLPAIILPDGTVLYYYHGDQHRVGGAAVLRADGSYEFSLLLSYIGRMVLRNVMNLIRSSITSTVCYIALMVRLSSIKTVVENGISMVSFTTQRQLMKRLVIYI
jgi:hypothetical protein